MDGTMNGTMNGAMNGTMNGAMNGTMDGTMVQSEQRMAQDAGKETIALTPEEEATVAQYAAGINLYDSNAVLQYGAGIQKKMADFSEKTMENVRTKDMGEIGDLLSGVVMELKDFDEEEEKGFFSFLKKGANKLQSMKAKYEKVEGNINQICKNLEGYQMQLMKDSAILDKMYEQNLQYFKELSMYIEAGKRKLADVRERELPQMLQKAQLSGTQEDAQAVKDLESLAGRFEKKVHDLELTKMISLQTAPQIRLIQNNDTVMVEKIQSTLVNTIPLWKSQMVLALGMEHSMQAAEAQRNVTDMTNELLKKNAEKLQMASVETAKEAERGIADMETLKATNATLIHTLDEVMKIQQEGREKRKAAEVEIRRMENDLKHKLLEVRA